MRKLGHRGPLRCLPSCVAAVLVATAPVPAYAQDLIAYFWGGGREHGGGRHTLSFSHDFEAGEIIVSFADRRLYHVIRKGRATSYPIAVPREQSRWEGRTVVSMKRENPAWTPTANMKRENPRLPSWVPGGHPMNPLGIRALYLGATTYRIHGTDAPWTIGQAVSKGCVRMYNEDVLDLYPKIPVGTRVTVTWQRFQAHKAASNADEEASASTILTRSTKHVRDARAE
ncbi:L,D-transpeptidase [Hyphomicrobium sp. NDB2Meth4]|uniref:L,D-transpeptidase n=1 Tax=Hyphomicrobium sp. NDB2Meth4 TaxID=1892846 RepID=UPI0009FB77CA|nr:L,D-transpeptidase [Hyphomicrobium sp. NDB2Meth4]